MLTVVMAWVLRACQAEEALLEAMQSQPPARATSAAAPPGLRPTTGDGDTDDLGVVDQQRVTHLIRELSLASKALSLERQDRQAERAAFARQAQHLADIAAASEQRLADVTQCLRDVTFAYSELRAKVDHAGDGRQRSRRGDPLSSVWRPDGSVAHLTPVRQAQALSMAVPPPGTPLTAYGVEGGDDDGVGDGAAVVDDAHRRIALLVQQSRFEEARAKEMEEIVYRSLAVSVAAQHQLAKQVAAGGNAVSGSGGSGNSSGGSGRGGWTGTGVGSGSGGISGSGTSRGPGAPRSGQQRW